MSKELRDAVQAVSLAVLMICSVVAGGVTFAESATAKIEPSDSAGDTFRVDVAASDLPGDGSQSNPYEISNVSELQAMEDELDANYVLVSNIDASNTAQFNDGNGFDPIGNSGSPFTGSLDGNNQTITGLTINRSTGNEFVGLFGVINSGTVKNITLTAVAVTGDFETGGVAGQVQGESRIQDVEVSGTVSSGFSPAGLAGEVTDNTVVKNVTASVNVTADPGDSSVGGLIGQLRGSASVSNAVARGNVTGVGGVGGLVGVIADNTTIQAATASGDVTGLFEAGGLVGSTFGGSIKNVTATGSVTVTTGGEFVSAGGLVGSNSAGSNGNGGTIQNATATGSVNGTNNVGGLVGVNDGGTIQNATATGSVTATGNLSGGLAGLNTGTITDATATGSVNGTEAVGGLVGVNNNDGTIQNAAAAETVTVTGEENVGGLVGDNEGTVQTATASGSVTAGGEFGSAGGLVGFNGGTIQNVSAFASVQTRFDGGGLVGTHAGIIRDSFAVGEVTETDDSTSLGGLVGFNDGVSVQDSYFDQRATNQSGAAINPDGLNLTTAQMQGEAARRNMSGFDFDNTWTTTSEYPALRALSETDESSGSGGPVQIDVDPGDLPGDGTESNPYQISNASELQAMEDELDANYTLVSDIDASNTARFNNGNGFDPIGDADSFDETEEEFNGTFDGNGQTITGLTVNRSGEGNLGLFGAVDSGTVTDVTIANVTIAGDFQVGGLAGITRGNSTIQNVSVSGTVNGTFDSGGLVGAAEDNTTIQNVAASVDVTDDDGGDSSAGGLVGGVEDNSVIQGATASGNVTGDGAVGGLVGRNFNSVQNVTASGNVSALNSFGAQQGGLVGRNRGTVQNASASGNVNGNNQVGGLAGSNSGSIQNTTAAGSVGGEFSVGGLIGVSDGTIQNVTASGDVTGSTQTGGLVGVNEAGTIRNATASGDISGRETAGGLAAVNNGTIQNATASGSVTGVFDIGGLIGENEEAGEVRNSEASGSVTDTGDFTNTGGLVGSNDGLIESVTASGDVTGSDKLGGLVGSHEGQIRNATASGEVVGNSSVGGFVGEALDGSRIQNGTAVGNVTGNSSVGGLAGFSNATIQDSIASGSVRGQSNVGAIAGRTGTDSVIENSTGSETVIREGQDPSTTVEIKHSPFVSGGGSGGSPRLMADDLSIEPVNAENITFGAGVNRTLVIENSSGSSVTIEPAETAGTTITSDFLIVDIYDTEGNIVEPVIASRGEQVTVEVSGDTEMFSTGVANTADERSDPFDTYQVSLRQEETIIDSTDQRLVGIGYNVGNGIQQNSTNGTIEVTIPRENLNNYQATEDSLVAGFIIQNESFNTVLRKNVTSANNGDEFIFTINTSEATPTEVGSNSTTTVGASLILYDAETLPPRSGFADDRVVQIFTTPEFTDGGFRVTPGSAPPANESDSVQLNLTTNQTTVERGDTVEFTTTVLADPVNATIAGPGFNDTTTGQDGTVTLPATVTGSLTVIAEKAPADGTEFTPDTAELRVSEPTITTPGAVQFGSVKLAETNKTTVTLTNNASVPIKPSPVEVTNGDDVFRITDRLDGHIAPGENETVTVAFEPTARGQKTGQLNIGGNEVTLSGTGAAPEINTTESTVEIAAQAGELTTQDISIENTGNAQLNASLSVSSNQFTLPSNRVTIPANTTETVALTFAPNQGETGVFDARVRVSPDSSVFSESSILVQGTAEQRAIELRQDNFDLGEVIVGQTTSGDIIVENTGTTTEEVNATTTGEFVLAPSDAESFILASGEQERVTVEINATTEGELTGTLSVKNESDTAISASADLTATAQKPEIDTTDTVSFSDTPTGSTTTEDIEITNDGSAPLEISFDSTFGSREQPNFTVLGATNRIVPAGGTETVAISFTPRTIGETTATLALKTNDPDASVKNITVSGTGTNATLRADTGEVTFGQVGLAGTQTESVTVTNDGQTAVTIDAVTVLNDNFTESTATSGTSLGSGESVEINITAEPEATGLETGTINITATDSGGDTTSVTTALTVVGRDSELALGQQTLRAGVTPAGNTSTGSVSVSNVGIEGTELSINETSVGGPFNITTTPETLASGETAQVEIEFTPAESTNNGEITDTLTLNASGDEVSFNRTVPVVGVVSAPEPTVSADTLGVGDVKTGESVIRTVTVSNNGGEPFSISNVTSDDTDVASQRIGPSEVVPGGETTIVVTVNRSEVGAFRSTTTIETVSGDVADPKVSVIGTGTAPELNVTDTDITFDTTSTGSADRKVITVENTGNATLILAQPTFGTNTDAFAVSGVNQRVAVAPGDSQEVVVTFTPPSTGEFTANLQVRSLDSGTTSQTVDLSGTGITADAGLNQSAVEFGDAGRNETQAQSITIENNGSVPIEVTGSSLIGPDTGAFDTNGLGRPILGAGENRSFEIELNTTNAARGAIAAELIINTNDTDVTGQLAATVAEPRADISGPVSASAFGPTRLGETTTAEIRVDNTGNAPLNITSLSANGGDDPAAFTVVRPTRTDVTVAPGSSEQVVVEFNPEAASSAVSRAQGARSLTATASLSVETNATETADTVALEGVGETAALEVPSTFQFGDTPLGEETTRQLTITNSIDATTPINITGVSVGGEDAEDYDASLNNSESPVTLAPGDSQTVDLSVTPTSTDRVFATLSVETDDTRQPVEIVGISNAETVAAVNFGSVNVTYISPTEQGEPTVDVNEGLQERNATLRTVDSNVSTVRDYTLNFTASASAAEFGQSELAAESVNSKDTTTTPFRYINATTSADEQNFTESTFRVTVSKAVLANQNVTPENVTIYHENTSDGYDQLNTKLLFETTSGYVYEATTESYSVFAVGGTPDGAFVDDDTDTGGNDDADPGGNDNADTGGNDDTDTGGSSGGGGSGEVSNIGNSPEASATGSAIVDASLDDQTLELEVRTPEPGDSAQVRLADEPVSERLTNNGASLNGLTITFAQDTDLDAQVSQSVTNPSDTTPDLTDETGAEAISYINVEESAEEDAIDDVEFEFSVSQDRLAQSRLNADQVSLYRYNGNAWEEYDATIESEDNNQVTYTATVPGLSVFTIGQSSAQVTTTPEPETDTPTPEPETGTPTSEPETDTPTSTPTSSPGFGVLIALAVLLAAALLVIRRNK